MQITRKLIITNTIWSAVAQVGVNAINLLILPLFIKNIGAELYGIWIISNVVLGYLNVFDFGFTQGLQKYVAEARVKGDQQELSEVVVSGVVLLLCIGLLIGGVFYMCAQPIVNFFSIQPENQFIAQRLLQISAFFCVFMWPLRIIDVVLSATMRIKELSCLNAFKIGVQSIIMLAMVSSSADILWIKWVTASWIVACSSYGLALVIKFTPEITWNLRYFQSHQLHRMHKFSMGMFYGAVIGLLSIQIDNLIIGKLLTMEAVTAYTICAMPYQFVQQASMLLLRTVLPVTYILNANKNSERIEELIYKSVLYRTCLTLPICGVLILYMPQFMEFWVGSNYLYVVFWARLFLIIPITACLGAGVLICNGLDSLTLVNRTSTFRILLNICISIICVRKIGIGGPILGTVVAVLLLGNYSFYPIICMRSKVKWKPSYFSHIKCVAIGCIVTSVWWIISSSYLVVNGLISLLLYSVSYCGVMVVFLFLFTPLKIEIFKIKERFDHA